ncbi:MAG: non-heme iron oxygenase ferredoxin subunit [Proteobacteria bacterium]|jgi:3-phenylpropionate/trans-cinnamate dioxygenase ferredoxin subunit|nr:non-heme iron oxygenase ferredoxin subunit [Pseudomonadota bacterium]
MGSAAESATRDAVGTWQKVGSVDDLADDAPLSVVVGDVEVGIYRVNGKLYAIEDVCPHQYALLTQGFVEGVNVECALHGAVFDITTGKCLKEPGGRDLRTYEVRENGGDVEILVE